MNMIQGDHCCTYHYEVDEGVVVDIDEAAVEAGEGPVGAWEKEGAVGIVVGRVLVDVVQDAGQGGGGDRGERDDVGGLPGVEHRLDRP